MDQNIWNEAAAASYTSNQVSKSHFTASVKTNWSTASQSSSTKTGGGTGGLVEGQRARLGQSQVHAAPVHDVIKAKGGQTKYYDILKFMDIFQRFNFSLKLLN